MAHYVTCFIELFCPCLRLYVLLVVPDRFVSERALPALALLEVPTVGIWFIITTSRTSILGRLK